jgi:hypothetical protein
VRALATVTTEVIDGVRTECYSDVYENRISPLLQALFCAASLAAFPLLQSIPLSVLHGLFIYYGFTTFHGSQLVERAMMLLTTKAMRPARQYLQKLPYSSVVWVTVLQLVLVAIIFGVTKSPAAPAFPLFIVMLVPVVCSGSIYFSYVLKLRCLYFNFNFNSYSYLYKYLYLHLHLHLYLYSAAVCHAVLLDCLPFQVFRCVGCTRG